jgi:TonB family protein
MNRPKLAAHVPFLIWGIAIPGGEVSMRSSWKQKALVGAAFMSLLGTYTLAQSGTTEEGKRKAKTKIAPVYPDLAKRMNVSGKVKVEVTIAPDGHVKTSRALGGHPILVQACLDAVKEWKFVAAPEESTQVIEFEFSAN